MLERIEGECDLEDYRQAMEEHLSNPETYALDEAEKELGLR